MIFLLNLLNNYQYSSNPYIYNPNMEKPVSTYKNAIELSNLKKQGITYEDLASLLYGNK